MSNHIRQHVNTPITVHRYECPTAGLNYKLKQAKAKNPRQTILECTSLTDTRQQFLGTLFQILEEQELAGFFRINRHWLLQLIPQEQITRSLLCISTTGSNDLERSDIKLEAASFPIEYKIFCSTFYAKP